MKITFEEWKIIPYLLIILLIIFFDYFSPIKAYSKLLKIPDQIVTNEEYVNRLHSIAKKIIDILPEEERKKINLNYIVVVDAGEENAWGGKGTDGNYWVAVDYRLIKKLPEDELAFVVAHEIAHCTLNHKRPVLVPPKTLIDRIFWEPIEKSLQREQERAADRFGVLYMTKAGYNPEGAIKFMERQLKENKILEYASRILWFLFGHPTYTERRDYLHKQISQMLQSHVQQAINEGLSKVWSLYIPSTYESYAQSTVPTISKIWEESREIERRYEELFLLKNSQEDIKRERLVKGLEIQNLNLQNEEKLEIVSGYLASLPEAKWIYFGAGSGSPIEMKRKGSIVDFTFHIPNYVNVGSTQFTLTADLSSAYKSSSKSSSKYFKFFAMKFRNPNDKTIFNFKTLGTYSSDKEDFFGFNFYYDSVFDFDLDYRSNEPRLQGYYGYKTPVRNLPSDGVYIYGFYYWGSDIKLVHPKGYTYEIDEGYGVVDWKKHKVYLVATRSSYPSGLALFIGDQIGNQIKGKFMVKSLTSANIDPWYEKQSITIPKFILSETKDNFVQFLGKDEPLVLAWTFNAQWVDNRGDSVSSLGILMGNLIEKTSFTENIVNDNEIWKGFAVGYIQDLTNSNVIFAKNTELENIKFTFKPSTSQFKGEISVFDEFNNKYTLTTDYSDSVYIHHASFGAIKEVNNSPAFIASYSSPEYSYLSWGHWGVDINDATSQKSVYWFSPWIVGRLTPDNEIPKTGTATYSGYVWGDLIERDSYNNIIYFGGVEGKSQLVVDFGKRTLEGKFYNMKKYFSEPWKDIQVTASWGDRNKITGTTFTSDGLSGTINCAFFGPNANEIGGNWDLKGTENGKTVQAAGIFTGKR